MVRLVLCKRCAAVIALMSGTLVDGVFEAQMPDGTTQTVPIMPGQLFVVRTAACHLCPNVLAGLPWCEKPACSCRAGKCDGYSDDLSPEAASDAVRDAFVIKSGKAERIVIPSGAFDIYLPDMSGLEG